MKKVLKIAGIILLLFLAILISIPFVLESKIDTIVQKYADDNLNAELSFNDISLSLISSFPKAEITIDNLKLINRMPFEGTTLASAKMISFKMPIPQLLKGTEEPLAINEIIANELYLMLKTNKEGLVNYDIVKTEDNSQSEQNETTSTAMRFDIESYQLYNSAFTFIDEGSDIQFYAAEINHSGKGIFSAEKSELDTHTDTKISVTVDSTKYLSDINITLDALIDLDLEQQRYTFKENKGYINALRIEFEGFMELVDEGQLIDIQFKNPESSFKDFLAIIPEAYAKNIENVNTTGDFTVNGMIKGLISDTTIPTLDINMRSDNASFKYPDLPKSVEDIIINASVKNTTGNADDTYVDLNQLDFRIDEDKFKSEAHIKNLTGNSIIEANLNGTLNLANITKAYPMQLNAQFSGVLKGELSTSFDMKAIETNDYNRIKNNGNISISDVVFSSEDFANPIEINSANLSFKPGIVTLNDFNLVTGSSDISANGVVNNLLGFLLSDKKLQGDFIMNSDQFVISDFITDNNADLESSNEPTSDLASLKIPEFLDCSLTATARTLKYDNLNLTNLTGKLVIKNQTANLKSMKMDIFKGQLNLSGEVNTKEVNPVFDLKLNMQQFDISQSFKDLDMLTMLAPIANVLQGKFNSTITISGLLNDSLTPNLNTISGNARAQILTTQIDASENAILSELNNRLTFLDLDQLDLKGLKTELNFHDGEVDIEPFTINYKDIPIEIFGSHSFSNTMNYKVILQVPAKYLGGEVNKLLSTMNDSHLKEISIPITANIEGTARNPIIKTDLTSGVSSLTAQLIEIQKQKAIGQGKDKVNALVSGLLSKNSDTTARDSTKAPKTEETIKKGVNSILGGILGGKKKTKKVQDSTKN